MRPLVAIACAFLLQQVHAAENCPAAETALAKTAGAVCDIEQSADCQDVAANPETRAFARSCHDPSDQRWPVTKVASACTSAVGKAWGDIWIELADTAKANKAYYDDCESDPSLKCKKQLAQESYFTYKSDAELADVSTLDLLRKRDNVRSLARRDPAYRATLEKNGVSLPAGGNGIGGEGLLAAAKEQVKKLGVKLECYNAAGYAHLLCYGAASLADPSLVAGGVALKGLQGIRWASAVLKANRAERAVAKIVEKSAGLEAVDKASREALEATPNGWNYESELHPSLERQFTEEGREVVGADNLQKLSPNDRGYTSPEMSRHNENRHELLATRSEFGQKTIESFKKEAVSSGEIEIKETISAKEVNAATLADGVKRNKPYYRAPYDEKSPVYKAQSKKPLRLCQINTAGAAIGKYYFPCSYLKQLSPTQLRDYLALPDSNLANQITEYVIPAGREIEISVAGAQVQRISNRLDSNFAGPAVGGGGFGGGVQIRIPDSDGVTFSRNITP